MNRLIKIYLAVFIILFASLKLFSKEPYLLLVSLDGFRWDYLHRGITPNLNKFADSGVRAMSLTPCFPSVTFPNHYSIITGMYPENHGIIANTFMNPNTNEVYKLSDPSSVKDGRWYLGEAFWETAKRNGIKTASYFWPGSEMDLDYRRPDYYKTFNGKTPFIDRVNGVIDWLTLPYNSRPHFITLYFQEPDHSGHEYGPNAPETDSAIKSVDSIIGILMSKIDSLDIKDSLNIIIVSDHGMTDVDSNRTIDFSEILGDSKSLIQNYGTMAMIEPVDNIDFTYNLLKLNENHYHVYKKSEMPDYYHFSNNPFISSIIIIADPKWLLIEKGKTGDYASKLKGTHGYDNHFIDMQAIFLAGGPAFKVQYQCPSLQNIDIYPLMCNIFSIKPRSNIDGKFCRIGFILK